MHSRTLAIGDIHGGLKALLEVLDKAEVTERDHLIFLGDYVDGWSDSANLISFLIELNATHNCLFLRGNHDELLYNYLAKNHCPDKWLMHGGQQTVDAYKNLDKQTLSLHINFLESLQNYHIDTQNRLFVHAGFSNLGGPELEFYPNMVYWDRSLWELVAAMEPNLPKEDVCFPQRLKIFDEIYIGHTPTTRLGSTLPLNFYQVWNLDTGAAFKGSLTIMNINTKEYWQSTPVYQLYPKENGRN